MRPAAPDIAAPPFPPDLEWTGSAPRRMEALTARGPVLVHFFDFAQLNSVRTLPYVRGWEERYREHGLSVLGVHSPRYPFTASGEAVAGAASRLGIRYPVAVDARHRMWNDYGCRGWPSLFLWARGGVLRWAHFGEGEYQATEQEIRSLVSARDPRAKLPAPMPPLRPSDEPGARVLPPSEEVFPGGSMQEPWRAGGGESLDIDYAAGGAYAALDGEGELELERDGADQEAIEIRAPGLYELSVHARHERHSLALRPSLGVRVWSVSFAPGVP